jgi:hypothetical protein
MLDSKDKKKHAAPKPVIKRPGIKAVWNGTKWVKEPMTKDERNKQKKQAGRKTGKRRNVVRVNQLGPTETNDGETLDERAIIGFSGIKLIDTYYVTALSCFSACLFLLFISFILSHRLLYPFSTIPHCFYTWPFNYWFRSCMLFLIL